MKNDFFSYSAKFYQDLLVHNRQLYYLFIKDFLFFLKTKENFLQFHSKSPKMFQHKEKDFSSLYFDYDVDFLKIQNLQEVESCIQLLFKISKQL